MNRTAIGGYHGVAIQSQSFHAFDFQCPSGSPGARGCFLEWQIGITLRGNCRYHFNGHEVWMGPGDLKIVRPTTEIVWEVPGAAGGEGWRTVYCVFNPRPHWLELLQFSETVPGCTILHLADTDLLTRLRRMLISACKLYGGGTPQHDQWAMLAMERLLLTLGEYRREQAIDGRVNRARMLLDSQYARDWTVDELARECHASTAHLAVLFQGAVGAAPMQYLEQVRMRRALAMLTLGHSSIAEIARSLGYAYPSYFARRFRRVTGQSPLEYRNSSRPMAPAPYGGG